MAGTQNLKPIRDSETARRLQKRSSIAQKANHKQRLAIREELERQLKTTFPDYVGSIISKAIEDKDTKAWELIRDTLGEKPIDRQEIKYDNSPVDELVKSIDTIKKHEDK